MNRINFDREFCFSYAGKIYYFAVNIDESKFPITKLSAPRGSPIKEFVSDSGYSYRVQFNEKKELEAYYYDVISKKDKIDKKFIHMKIPVVEERQNIKTPAVPDYYWYSLSNTHSLQNLNIIKKEVICEIRTYNQLAGVFIQMSTNFRKFIPIRFILTIISKDKMAISLTNVPSYIFGRLEFNLTLNKKVFIGKNCDFQLSVNFSNFQPFVSLHKGEEVKFSGELIQQTSMIEQQLDYCDIHLFNTEKT